jgi:hypothetical protein
MTTLNKKTLSYHFNWLPLDLRKYIFEFLIPNQSKIIFLDYSPLNDINYQTLYLKLYNTNYQARYLRGYIDNSLISIKYNNYTYSLSIIKKKNKNRYYITKSIILRECTGCGSEKCLVNYCGYYYEEEVFKSIYVGNDIYFALLCFYSNNKNMDSNPKFSEFFTF